MTAENAALEPPDVEDSRTFGPLQLSAVVGRCVYAVRNKADRQPIENNAQWRGLDGDIVAAELTEELLASLDAPATA